MTVCRTFEQRHADGDADALRHKDMLMRMMELVDECLESSTDDFKLTITDIVDDIEASRGVHTHPVCIHHRLGGMKS